MFEDKSGVFRIQKIIAWTVFTLGTAVTIVNLVFICLEEGFISALRHQSVVVLFATTLIFLFTAFWDALWCRVLQIALGFLTGALGILDAYNSIHGIGLFILFIIIAFKYGFFSRWLIPKAVFLLMTIFILIEISAKSQYSENSWSKSLDSIIYLTLFLFILYQIYSHEIKSYLTRAKKAESAVENLRGQRKNLLEELDALNSMIDDLQAELEPVDIDVFGLTGREKEVVRALVVYRETDKDLAKRLGISHQTVKVHFKHIRDKMGVDRREEIIDLCRNNF